MQYLIIKYIKTPDGKFNEQALVETKLRAKDYDTAAVILDYKNKKVLKAVIDNKVLPRNFERFDQYYKEFFPDVVGSLRIANN